MDGNSPNEAIVTQSNDDGIDFETEEMFEETEGGDDDIIDELFDSLDDEDLAEDEELESIFDDLNCEDFDGTVEGEDYVVEEIEAE